MMNVSAFIKSTARPMRGWRHYRSILFILTGIVSPALVQGTEMFTEKLAFEREGLDLDTALVIETVYPVEDEGIDVRISFNALWSPGAVVEPAVYSVTY